MANLDSQVEIVSIELLRNPEETQIWKGENESVSSRQDLFLFLFIYAPYCRLYLTSKDWNGLIDVKEKLKILKSFLKTQAEIKPSCHHVL